MCLQGTLTTKDDLTVLVSESLPVSIPTVWTGAVVELLQTAITVDPPTACELLRLSGHKGTDETDEVVRRRVHELTLIATKNWVEGGHFSWHTQFSHVLVM